MPDPQYGINHAVFDKYIADRERLPKRIVGFGQLERGLGTIAGNPLLQEYMNSISQWAGSANGARPPAASAPPPPETDDPYQEDLLNALLRTMMLKMFKDKIDYSQPFTSTVTPDGDYWPGATVPSDPNNPGHYSKEELDAIWKSRGLKQ